MSKLELCEDGRCKRVRLGEERHSKHVNDAHLENSDRDAPFRNRKFVMAIFYSFIIIAGIFTFLTTTVTDLLVKVITSTFIVIFIGLAFAVLNKGDNIRMRDQVHRIESKLDKILEHRDDVFQNK